MWLAISTNAFTMSHVHYVMAVEIIMAHINAIIYVLTRLKTEKTISVISPSFITRKISQK